jgi:hypothetical protein
MKTTREIYNEIFLPCQDLKSVQNNLLQVILYIDKMDKSDIVEFQFTSMSYMRTYAKAAVARLLKLNPNLQTLTEVYVPKNRKEYITRTLYFVCQVCKDVEEVYLFLLDIIYSLKIEMNRKYSLEAILQLRKNYKDKPKQETPTERALRLIRENSYYGVMGSPYDDPLHIIDGLELKYTPDKKEESMMDEGKLVKLSETYPEIAKYMGQDYEYPAEPVADSGLQMVKRAIEKSYPDDLIKDIFNTLINSPLTLGIWNKV